jgi:hypothetical protein
VNVAEATLAKQADLLLCSSMNTGTISNRVFQKNKNYPNMPMKRVIEWAG